MSHSAFKSFAQRGSLGLKSPHWDHQCPMKYMGLIEAQTQILSVQNVPFEIYGAQKGSQGITEKQKGSLKAVGLTVANFFLCKMSDTLASETKCRLRVLNQVFLAQAPTSCSQNVPVKTHLRKTTAWRSSCRHPTSKKWCENVVFINRLT